MLLRLILENFLSFDKPQEFNMFPNPNQGENYDHIYTRREIPLLKQSAIYGNNAAGKSNLIKGIDVLRRFATDETFLSEMQIERYRYRLKEKSNRPIELLVEFKAGRQCYIYDIALSPKGVEREDLYISGLGRKENTLLYHRSFERVELGKYLPQVQRKRWQHTEDIVQRMLADSHRYASFLSLLQKFPVLVSEHLEQVYHWFMHQLEVIQIHSELPQLIALLHTHDDVLEFANTIFSQLGIGVDSVQVQSTDAEEWLKLHSGHFSQEALQELQGDKALSAYASSNRPIFTALIEHGQKKVQELIFEQISQDGTFTLDVLDQSDGTVRILTLLPAIYAAIKSEKTVFIDEINHCVHPKLIYDLVRFFANSQTKGQLIFSTHETELMEQDRLLRRDEIWFVEKTLGASSLHSLNEFKKLETISTRRGYQEGRFGGTYRGRIQFHQDA